MSTTLKQVKEEKDEEERRLLEAGQGDAKITTDGRGDDQGLGEKGLTKEKEDELEHKMKVDGEGEEKKPKQEEQDEGDEDEEKLAIERKNKKKEALIKKEQAAKEASGFSLTAEEAYQARRRERFKAREEAMSKPCTSTFS